MRCASSVVQVQFLAMLQRSRLRAEMAAERAARERAAAAEAAAAEAGAPAAARAVAPGDNFFQLLQDAKDILPDNEWWV